MNLSRLDELRSILLKPDQKKLDDINERLENPEQRTHDVAEILPESIAASFKQDSRLVGALRTPLRQCVAESVRENPDEYADALFPVMGPAIRRSIADALRGWTQQINNVIEQSLSPRGIGWRIQAWRAGVPFAQYVLQQTLLYRVEDVYLIHSASGLLVDHVSQDDTPIQDEDAVSAMFTAIQEFVKDSFTKASSERLTTAEFGDLTLWAVHGPTTSIVAAIRGNPPVAMRARLETTLEKIETQHSHALRDYSGDRDSMAGLSPDLQACLLVSLRDQSKHQEKKQLFSPAHALLAVLVVGIVAWLSYSLWMRSEVARVTEGFAQTPGILLIGVERDGDTIRVRGLRDPLAASATDIAARAGWNGLIEEDFRPFLSLEHDIVLERARTALAAPNTVSIELNDRTLALAGTAPPDWHSAAAAAVAYMPGIDAIDTTALSIDPSGLLAMLRAQLNPPPSVMLSLQGEELQISGVASKVWLDTALAMQLPRGVQSIDYSELAFSEIGAMLEIAQTANQIVIAFEQGRTIVAAEDRDKVRQLAENVARYAALAQRLGQTPRLTITGHSDGSGSVELNMALELRRAESLAAELRNAGIESFWITTQSQIAAQTPGERAALATVHLAAQSSAPSLVELDGRN